jgi:hypothetical protein
VNINVNNPLNSYYRNKHSKMKNTRKGGGEKEGEERRGRGRWEEQ